MADATPPAPARRRGRPKGSSELHALLTDVQERRSHHRSTTRQVVDLWDSDSDDEWLPPHTSNSDSEEDDSDDDSEFWPDEVPDDNQHEDEVVEKVDMRNLSYMDVEPEGFRLVDISSLNTWLKTEVCCGTCAEARTKDILQEFIDYCAESNFPWTKKLRSKLLDFHKRANRSKKSATKVKVVPGVKIVQESVNGWSSQLSMQCCCSKKHAPKPLLTSKKLQQKYSKQMPEVNVRMCDAMLNIGRGSNDWLWIAAKLNTPLSLNNYWTQFRNAERHIGKVAEEMARESCDTIVDLAAELSRENGSTAAVYDGRNIYPIAAGLDGAWAKRGTGKRYDSNGGVVTATFQPPCCTPKTPRATQLMRLLDKKILDFQCKQKNCRACQLERTKQRHANRGVEGFVPVLTREFKLKHSCRENHHGLHSKAMEWRGALDIGLRLLERDVYMETIVSDDDSTMKAHLSGTKEPSMPEPVRTTTCNADPSHRTRTVAAKFFDLCNSKIAGEEEGDSRMSKKVAQKVKQYHGYVQHLRGCCDNPDLQQFREHWMCMLEHLFDNHSQCARFFECRALKERDQEAGGKGDYVPDIAHPLLVKQDTGRIVASEKTTGRRYLYGAALYARMKTLFEDWSTDERLRQSMHQQKTQINEAINNGYWAKCPKARDYTHSSSFAIRISFRVAEQNMRLVPFHFECGELIGTKLGRWGMRVMQDLYNRRSVHYKTQALPQSKAKRTYEKVLSNKEAHAVGTLSYDSRKHHDGVTDLQIVRAVL
eukprot:SAG11_NODE_3302_length_2537_cov_8.562346_1_plen_763_part_10